MAEFHYDQLEQNLNLVNRFVLLYSDYMSKARDYGTGEKLHMVEVHILASIAENPGIYPTALARMWDRTKGAISQTVSRLAAKGYVEKRPVAGNHKQIALYPTDKGWELAEAHRAYDMRGLWANQEFLLAACTQEELDVFYKVMERYVELLLD